MSASPLCHARPERCRSFGTKKQLQTPPVVLHPLREHDVKLRSFVGWAQSGEQAKGIRHDSEFSMLFDAIGDGSTDNYGPMMRRVPFGTARAITSISPVTATQPRVQFKTR